MYAWPVSFWRRHPHWERDVMNFLWNWILFPLEVSFHFFYTFDSFSDSKIIRYFALKQQKKKHQLVHHQRIHLLMSVDVRKCVILLGRFFLLWLLWLLFACWTLMVDHMLMCNAIKSRSSVSANLFFSPLLQNQESFISFCVLATFFSPQCSSDLFF